MGARNNNSENIVWECVQGREQENRVEVIAGDNESPRKWNVRMCDGGDERRRVLHSYKQHSNPSVRAYYERHAGQFLKCDARFVM